ncbi:MAG: hypothetical protein FWG46_02625 [Treponema sp.]|nr:hypothetical protein [Treponema sp.]
MANKPEDFPIFTSLDKNTIQNMLLKMSNYLYNVSEILRIDHRKIDTSMEIMYEIIERIEKRRIYFHIWEPLKINIFMNLPPMHKLM